MGRKRAALYLPEDVQKRLAAMILDGKYTIGAIQKYIEGQAQKRGFTPLSVSTVGRESKIIKTTAEALRESREATKALLQEFGPTALEGDQGRLLVEMVRALVFRFLKPLLENEESKMDAKELASISRSVRELSQSLRNDQEYLTKVQAEAARRAREKAAEAVATAGREAGLSSDLILSIQKYVLGVDLEKKEGQV